MKPTIWTWYATLAAGVVLALGMSPAVFGQESLEERLARQEKQIEEIRKNAEVLQKQNEALMKLLSSGTASTPVSTSGPAPLAADDVRNIVNGYLQEKEAQQKAAQAVGSTDADGKYKIGSDLRMAATWRNGLVISTTHDDFSMHIGGWVQYDNVFWDQSTLLKAAPGARPGPKQGVAYGVSAGGIGDLQDGTYFRRIRLQTDGKFWENYEYTLTLALENNQFSTIGLDEFWVGGTNIPVLGTVRFGHVKNAIGLEADMSASSKVMTFMERSSYSESIELNQNFVTGMWMGNNYFDQRATWSGVIFRPDNGASSGAFYGDGQWGWQGRLTALPLYENDGRHLLHLGLSGGWRTGTNNLTTSALKTIQLRARPELRDDDPAAQGGTPTAPVAGGAQDIPNANSNRMIDTGAIVAPHDYLMGTELLYILGPLSIQGEYGWNFVQDATGFAPAGSKITNALATAQNYTFSGGYAQLAYTLTGENRAYDKRLGRLDSYYFSRKGNYSNAWLVRDEDGRLNWSMGTWEVAARYSYVDLNDGSGLNTIQGGRMDGLTLGLNWYLNDNMKFQFDYVYDHRYDLPSTAIPGSTRGFGMRMQFNY
jgi:phosphate-selective porin OprO/OprP